MNNAQCVEINEQRISLFAAKNHPNKRNKHISSEVHFYHKHNVGHKVLYKQNTHSFLSKSSTVEIVTSLYRYSKPTLPDPKKVDHTRSTHPHIEICVKQFLYNQACAKNALHDKSHA